MKDIRFVLKDYKSEKPVTVFLQYACDDRIVLKYSTGEKVTVDNWRAKRLPRSLDRRMAALKTYVDRFVKRAENAGKEVISTELYKYLLAKTGDKRPVKKEPMQNIFFGQLRVLIGDAKAGRQPIYSGKRMGGNYSEGTLKHWDLAYNKLREWNPDLSWNITMKDYNNFIAWCNHKDQNFRPNYIGTIIKMWKVFMNLGYDRGWHNNHIHLSKGFKKLTEKVQKIYLTEEEIQSIINVPLTGVQKTIRDGFVINLNLGLRISDMKELSMENVKDGIIKSVNRKTGLITAVPANGDILRILKEYGRFPKSYPEQTINREIKKIAEKAGIVQIVQYTETIGGVELISEQRKCDLISNHTCRRSFITNKLKKISIADVAKFVGSTIKNIEHYNKISVDELAAKWLGQEAFK